MPRPWKHSSGTYYLRQRVPADLRRFAKGQRIVLAVGGRDHSILIGEHVKVSLGTKDAPVAKQRFREADDALSLQWQRLRSAPLELSHRQILALAGEVHLELLERFDEEPLDPEDWAQVIRLVVMATNGLEDGSAEDVRETLEAFLGKAADIRLQAKQLNVSQTSRDRLLFQIALALAKGAHDNMEKAKGNYSPSPYIDRYPKWKPIAAPSTPINNEGQSISGLYERWKKAREAEGGSPSSAKRWAGPIKALITFLGHDNAALVTPQDLLRWRDTVLEEGSSSLSTFSRVHLPAVKAIYSNGISSFLVTRNPAAGITIRAPKAVKERPQGFTNSEAESILKAANNALDAPGGTEAILRRAYRWVPWLCAYSGARVGEITQLRKKDVAEVDGVMCLRITPEAGTVKNKAYRDVPLHPHMLEQGFVQFVKGLPEGPIFYSPDTASDTPWSTTSGRLAKWVREVAKVTDTRVGPNHGWRHTFRAVGMGAGIEGRYIDDLCGHAHRTQGEKYGDAPMSALKREMDKFPRWAV